MSEYIKRIETPSGDKQIDYTALANLPPMKADENNNIVCDNGLKMFKDFSMQGWAYGVAEDGFLHTAINGPFSPTIKITEIDCKLVCIDYIKDGFWLWVRESVDDDENIPGIFPPEYFDYELQPAETITEVYYDLFCESKFVLRSDGKVYSLNSELSDLKAWTEGSSNITPGGRLGDDYEGIPLKVIITSTVDKLKAYMEHLKSLEDGGGEE